MITADFAIPGDINNPTGGYVYAREILTAATGLNAELRHVALAGAFPNPSNADLEKAGRILAAGTGPVLIDGLAAGALPAETIAGLGRPVVILCHHPLGLETGQSPERAAQLLQNEARVLRAASGVVVTSETTRHVLLTRLGVDPDHIVVAPPGVTRVDAAPRRNTPPVILTVGSLIRRKAHDVLLSALHDISDLPWISLWIGSDAFDPGWAASLRDQAARFSLIHRLEHHKNLSMETVRQMYQSADVFCLPSRYEGYGMAVADAMMAGLPVLACDAGSIGEVVPAGTGLLSPPDDPVALAANLRSVLSDARRTDDLSRNARIRAEGFATWAGTTQNILNALTGQIR